MLTAWLFSLGLCISLAWARIDGCASTRRVVAKRQLPRGKSIQTAREHEDEHCRPAPILLWQYDHTGHVWPGGQQHYLQRILGPGTQVIDANEAMWQFFQHFRLRQL